MIIYFRHGKDKNVGYKHDERITKEGKIEIENFAVKMVEEYGLPDIICYSPLYRTRQTAKYIIRKIEEIKDDVNIKLLLDPRLGRFFTGKERDNPDIHRSTYEKGPIIYESKNGFKKRVKKQLQFCKKRRNEGKIIWNITHSLVILRVAELENIDRNSHVEYLDTVVIS